MPSIYLTTGQLVHKGPAGAAYTSQEEAERDANRRNKAAERLGIQARYVAK